MSVAFLVAIVVACAGGPRLSGTELGDQMAPDFTLTDGMSGQSLTFSTLRGRVVAMAFLYTRCPDVCPLTAAEFRASQRALGSDASRVEFVAVSVDPDGDTPSAVRAFSDAHDLREHWHYLIGARPQLQQVWSLYGVGSMSPDGMRLQHNDAIYLIDSRGRERVLNHSDDAPNTLLNNLKILLAER